ncbi:MAG: iron chelate uptake ABC transporter family permease subunit [Pseudomonadota bacterium]
MSTLTLRFAAFSMRVPRRLVVVNATLFAVLLVVVFAGLLGGTYPIGLQELTAVLSGTADPVTYMVVMENRLPRLLTALGVGLAFGMAGEMVQTLLRNPLASPDVIGFSAGAGLGAVITVALTGATGLVLPGALAGGAMTAALLLALVWNKCMSPGAIVLVGIGLTVTLGVMTDLMMVRLDANNVGELVKWIMGSLSARSWADTGLVWAGLAVVAPLAAWHQFALTRLTLADDVATSLGQSIVQGRVITIFFAVVLVGFGVAAAGPLPFVAFVAGPIAHGLSRAPRPTLLTAALVGALVTLLADRIAQALPGFLVLPAGIFTALIGAPVLIWVLIAQSRRRRR